MNAKHIEPVVIESHYHTGIPEWFSSNGLRFHWFSWLLCEISNRSGNPIHYAIFTDFRFHAKLGFTASRWNPSYEDDQHHEDVALKSLHHWRPVAVVSLKGSDLFES